jgi:hypothetical protein
LEGKFPARVGKTEEAHIEGGMDIEIAHYSLDIT